MSMFGLSVETILLIQSVFAQYNEVEEALLYGSRAKGTYKPGSDIDITLLGTNLNLSIQHQIENDLDDLMLPYQVDLSIRHQIQTPALLHHIERVGITIYTKSKQNEG